MRGKGGPENSACKYKGVRQRTWGKWVSEIREPNRGERIWIGTFDDSKSAALAYDKAAIRIFGATAKLNFPDMLPQPCCSICGLDAIADQMLYGANDELNFLKEELIKMQQDEYAPDDEVSLISNPYAFLVNDHVYGNYYDQFILHESQRSVAPTVHNGESQGNNVVENDGYEKEKREDILRVELPEHDDSSLWAEAMESTDFGKFISCKFEDVGEDLGLNNFWLETMPRKLGA